MVKGGMHGKRGGMRGMHPPPLRYGRSLRGRYASYWNAFLLGIFLGFFKYQEVKGKESGSGGSRVCMIAEIDQIHVTQFAEPTLVNKSIFIRD